MEKKNLSKKQELAQDLGLKFDEAAELFSEETLGTMRMVSTVGGSDDDNDDPGAKLGVCIDAGICITVEVKVWKCNKGDGEEDKPTPSTPPVTLPELPTPTIVPITTAPPVLPPERPGTTK